MNTHTLFPAYRTVVGGRSLSQQVVLTWDRRVLPAVCVCVRSRHKEKMVPDFIPLMSMGTHRGQVLPRPHAEASCGAGGDL